MKNLLIVLFLFFGSTIAYAQQRILKKQQPNLIELMMVEIKLNPADTIFNNVSFDHLPVKGYPLFTAVPGMPFYTESRRDSVLKRIDDLFFE